VPEPEARLAVTTVKPFQLTQIAELIQHLQLRLRIKNDTRGRRGRRLRLNGQRPGCAGQFVHLTERREIRINSGDDRSARITRETADVGIGETEQPCRRAPAPGDC